jgi:transketolase
MLVRENFVIHLISMSTIKPIDEQLLVQTAKETGVIVTVEEHSIIGGLAEAVAEGLSSISPVYIEPVGLLDTFARTSYQNP